MLFFVPLLGFAGTPKNQFQILNTQGRFLTQKGEWDLAQVKFEKALKSPSVDERIEAYEGLADLYTSLRMNKKKIQIEESLEAERKFKRSLVPRWDSYYGHYEAKEGDTYQKIALRNKISLEWLLKANHRKVLRQGEMIRLPKIRYSLVVDKTEKTLTWKRGSEIIKNYPIAIGAEKMETPGGEFEIVNKVKNPVWYKLDKQYSPDSPENLLGTRWMGMSQKGYGIHGTRNPESIGKAASHGCIRMYNRDVEELFKWVPVGTKVVIN